MRWWTSALAVGMFGCDPGNPCDAYVDYMCDCHPEVSCADLATTYADPDPGVQDECAILLDQQEGEDADDGLVCLGTTATDSG